MSYVKAVKEHEHKEKSPIVQAELKASLQTLEVCRLNNYWHRPAVGVLIHNASKKEIAYFSAAAGGVRPPPLDPEDDRDAQGC